MSLGCNVCSLWLLIGQMVIVDHHRRGAHVKLQLSLPFLTLNGAHCASLIAQRCVSATQFAHNIRHSRIGSLVKDKRLRLLTFFMIRYSNSLCFIRRLRSCKRLVFRSTCLTSSSVSIRSGTSGNPSLLLLKWTCRPHLPAPRTHTAWWCLIAAR